MSTVMLNCCLAQLSTFSVQQAATMNTKLGSLKVPPASLPVVPVLFYHDPCTGTGLVLSIVGMAIAALVEIKRKKVAAESGLINSAQPLPITFLWVALQYLFLGSADLFTLAGMMEFFFTEAPSSMRSLATALSWASLAIGYYLSSVIVSIVNSVTSAYRQRPWLFGSNLNHYHLERFYWLMCLLSGLNFVHFLFWANRYKYRSMQGPE
ncbi:Protein NRT1/ PTR FAMILY 4.6 [Morella rubra]|uniref:Protein NRT1/ PTR FAMILY 4.6 n=1 Tax=Morella rubra TaxID=262757 RepID=A0A6A1W3M8_9ROSI|nr:Protein NRT1/ PTR FAMILY 4.6 [Morella rubra]